MMQENDLSVFQLEREDFKLFLKKEKKEKIKRTPAPAYAALTDELGADTRETPNRHSESARSSDKENATNERCKEITSPLVGTFYSSPSPELPPYVEVGQKINEDTIVCILEAMKVMNEIKAECTGTIIKTVAENGCPVQYGEALFVVRLD